ncbi:hypothetical protein COU59_03245 [Candidatus Pacearchaeota archaeon CG10_big_fil_rev_8_21_14_0_10_34_12]|nr:MAG: hypothetical protein COU59_03245 [Candidatus Pacearchaeota archaeon CG10_big_fil_rev_8_21_14_0_10_34_12]
MVWQDIVIAIVIVFLAYALIPQIYKGFKEKRGLISLQTSIITGVGMYILSYIYFTLNLFFSATMVFISGLFWTILFFQKKFYK